MLDGLGLKKSEIVTAATVVSRCNVNAKPYDDKRVRNAIQLAVDNDAVLQLGANGMGIVAQNDHVGPMHPEHADLPPIKRDPVRARALLEEAGHLDFEFNLISVEADYRKESSEVVAQQMRDAGFKVKRTVIPEFAFWNDWTKYPFATTNWNARPLGWTLAARYDRMPQLASRMASAACRSTDTSWLTPCSAMVTPNRRFMRAMVIGLWVMMTKRVSVVAAISSIRLQKRSTL